MKSDDRQDLIQEKIDLFFGDETLCFQKSRLIKLLETAYENKFDGSLSTVTQLLFIHNEMIDLIDIGHLLNKAHRKKELKSNKNKIIKTVKSLRRKIGDWDNFPSHLAAFELPNPQLAINKFFLIHDIYEWKMLIRRYFDSAIGNLSMGESSNEFNIPLDSIELFRLLDAVWVFKVSIETYAVDNIETQ